MLTSLGTNKRAKNLTNEKNSNLPQTYENIKICAAYLQLSVRDG